MSNQADLYPVNVPERKLADFTAINHGQSYDSVGLPGDMATPSRFVYVALFSHWATPGVTALEVVNEGFHVLNTFDIFNGAIKSTRAESTPTTPSNSATQLVDTALATKRLPLPSLRNC